MEQTRNEHPTHPPPDPSWADVPCANPFRISLLPGPVIHSLALIALVPVGVVSALAALRIGRTHAGSEFFFQFLIAGFAGGILYFVISFVYRKGRHSRQLGLNASLAQERPRDYVLYLRSFRRSGHIVVPNHLGSVVDRRLMGSFWDVELGISYSLGQKLPTIAIGGTIRSLGAAKYDADDESWQSLFLQLAHQARAIYIIPDDRPGTLWELCQIWMNADLRRKTIVLMMPEQYGWKALTARLPHVSESWERVRTALATEISLPQYCPAGAFLQFDDNGRDFTQAEFANFHPMQVQNTFTSIYFRKRVAGHAARVMDGRTTGSGPSAARAPSTRFDEGLVSYFDPVWPVTGMCCVIIIVLTAPDAGAFESGLFITLIAALASLISSGTAFTLTRKPIGKFREWWLASTWFRCKRAPGLVRHAINFSTYCLLLFLTRSFLAEPYKIPSSSMAPTLLVGDLILVNKYTYGIRLPIVNTKIIAIDDPQRGDVMVFKYPKDMSQDYIKRVIGVPGDKITYENKRLTVNGVPVQYTPLDEYLDDERPVYYQQFVEKLPGMEHRMLNSDSARSFNLDSVEDFPHRDSCEYSYDRFTCIVPAGNYFTMGDNRDNSADSRYWGFVPDKNIVGKVFLVWMNVNDRRRIGRVQ